MSKENLEMLQTSDLLTTYQKFLVRGQKSVFTCGSLENIKFLEIVKLVKSVILEFNETKDDILKFYKGC